MKRRHEENKKKPNVTKEVGGKPKPGYFGDPKLVPRVRQYLSANRNKRAINIVSIADDLQRHYGEYGRKKRNTFLKSVEKAYQVVCEEGLSESEDEVGEDSRDDISSLETKHLGKKKKEEDGDNSDSDGKSLSSDNQEYTFYEDRNSMNSFLTDLYKSSPGRQTVEQNSTNTHDSGENMEANGSRNNSNMTDFHTLRTDNIGQSVLGAETDAEATNCISQQDDRRFKEVSQLDKAVDSKPDTPKIRIGDSVVKDRRKVRKTPNKQHRRQSENVSDSSKGIQPQKVEVTFADVGGNEASLKEICKLIVHLRHPEVYQALGVTPPTGFLLHGPPGCGKTLLAHAIAGELDLPFIKVAAPEVVSGLSGESEEKIRDLFDKAVACAPCIVFIDEIDAITPKRETASKEMERRIVAQLLSCLDELNSKPSAHVLVIGATNRPDSLDPALRRAGRFDREISLGIPDEPARARILTVLCRGLKLSEELDFHLLARNTPGFVGADLMALAREAAMTAVNRVFDDIEARQQGPCDQKTDDNRPVLSAIGIEDKSLQSVLNWLKDQPPLSEEQLKDLSVSMADFQAALQHVQPSAKREGFATIPDVTWDDIGALQAVREELQLSILAPIRHREDFIALGLTNPPGILLAGPPGCGKTLLAKAIANESGINFISVKGPELLNMYVGESERAVRQVFQRARNSAPCVIFFDELDALCPRRSDSGEGGSSVRVVNQLLTEMDGLEERKQVFIMGATNRPDIIDPAILRPGRLDKLLYVGLPSLEERLDILKTISKNGSKPPFAEDVCLSAVAEKCDGFSGADLAAIIRESSMVALKERISSTAPPSGEIKVHNRHFDLAFVKVKPSVSTKDQSIYDRMKSRLTL